MGASRTPGATLTFQDLDGTVEVIMTDGKPTGWKGSGHSLITLATGSAASFKGKKLEWTAKSTGPYVHEVDYTIK